MDATTKVYLSVCFLVLVIGIYFHRVPRDLNHQGIYDSFQGVFPDDEGYGYFYLVLQWPPSFCNIAPDKCHKEAKKFTYFTIHGLWPQKLKGGDINCTSGATFDYAKLQRDKKLIERMKKFWPNHEADKTDEVFWRIEWHKHGKCIGLDQNVYFNIAVNVYATEDISSLVEEFEKHGIDEGESYPIEQYKKAIESSRLHVTPNFQCNKRRQVQQLLEVRLCVSKKGQNFRIALSKWANAVLPLLPDFLSGTKLHRGQMQMQMQMQRKKISELHFQLPDDARQRPAFSLIK